MRNIQLKDIKTLREVAEEYNIPFTTLQYRLENLKEGIEYRKLGKRQPTILTPEGAKKLINGLNKIEQLENNFRVYFMGSWYLHLKTNAVQGKDKLNC